MANKMLPAQVNRDASERPAGAAGRETLGLRLPVFMYHRVAPDSGRCLPELTVSPQRFKSHLDWLKRHDYVTIGPGDLDQFRRGEGSIPPRAVMLTFDDAHEALVEHVFPLLLEYDFRATVFVVTGCLGKTNEWDMAEGWGPFPLMTAEQIRIWASRGMEFGAHSRTHRDLRRLAGVDLEREVAGSREDLEDLLAQPVPAFAYPFGFQNPQVVEEVHRNYRLAFLAGGGLNRPDTDMLLLRRVLVGPGDHGVSIRLLFATGWTPAGFWSAVKGRFNN